MLNLGALAFAAPWLLTALLALPVLWWLLRVTPPAPRQVRFPAIRLLAGLRPPEETPAHTPLWLLLLRLLLAALVIVALARPLLNPGTGLTEGGGPVMLVIDDGWAAAAQWPIRMEAAAEVLNQAGRAGRPVMLLTTAPPASGDPPQAPATLTAGEARNQLAALRPKPWGSDRAAALQALQSIEMSGGGETIWLSDGLEDGGAVALAERLQWLGPVQILHPPGGAQAFAMLPPAADGGGLTARAVRLNPERTATVWVRASADQGRLLGRESMSFAAGAAAAEVRIELPTELRNRLTRLEIEEQNSAGAVALLDERWRRRPVGIVSATALERDQPLLSERYYLERALTPFAEVRNGGIGELLQRELAVLILADVGQVIGAERQTVEDWLRQGGVLIRFAGPRLAEGGDDLMPVRLRGGGRDLGGALSWEQPAHVADFPETSPFHGLAVPADVAVHRQVLAEPSLDLDNRVWARLQDGTPLVTAERRGQGWLVLFHSTANTQWSSLPLSGLFVEMLRRLVDLSQGVAGTEGDTILPPYALLDGFGRFAGLPAAARPLSQAALADTPIGPRHPPGFYGTEDQRRALNIGAGIDALPPIGEMPSGIAVRELAASREVDLLPWLLSAALLLGLIDLLAALALRGTLLRRPAAALLLGALLAPGAGGGEAAAQPLNADDYAMAASLEFRLAYVLTGDPQVDGMSRAGLVGLSDALNRRSSVETADPMGVNIERDEILFFPLLYWPVVPEQRELSPAALARLDHFMRTGGTVLFDTRDQDLGGGFAPGRVGPGTERLRRLLAQIDLPPLIPVPEDHILTKAFYLLQEFPGRHSGGEVWVERHAGGSNDGVSSLVIGGNDWAAAWAVDDFGRPLAAVVPGGNRQREMAFRFGVNLVMYTLTGNYKADQVHVPALLERLGQ